MLIQGNYYKLQDGPEFKVIQPVNDSYFCRIVNQRDCFSISHEDAEKWIINGNITPIPTPDFDLTKGAQIRGGEIQDRTIS